MRKANNLATTYPNDVTCLYIQAYAMLIYAQHSCSIEKLATAFIKKALTVADRAADICSDSIVISLFRARLMLLLGQYEGVEMECRRGLNIKDPRDPNLDSISLKHAFQAEGDTYNDRVSYVYGRLNNLLDYISSEIRRFWHTMQPAEKGKILISSVNDVSKYSWEKNMPSAKVAMAACDALKFLKDKKQLNFWFCPIKQCCKEAFSTAESLLTHICIKVNQKLPQLSGENKSWSCSRMSLWKTHGGCSFLCLGIANEIFNAHMPSPQNEKSFQELIAEKRESRNVLFDVIQTKIQGIDNIQRNGLWCRLLDACLIDYAEFLRPVVGLFQRIQLIKQMCEDTNFTHRIDKGHIPSVFSDMGANKEENQQTKYQQENTFVVHWSEKKNRGYKWFLNADQWISNEHGNNWLLDVFQPLLGADGSVLDESLPISYVQSGNQVVLDPHPQFLEIQTNWRRLIIFKDNVPGTDTIGNLVLYFAWITGVRCGSPMIRCVVSSKRPLEELNLMFRTLIACQHPNILKPLGVWPCNQDLSMGYIVFPYFDGAISEISKDELFVKENQVIYDFTKVGHKFFRDILSAVHYINMNYNQGEAGIDHPRLPLHPLKLSLGHVFYLKDVEGEYHVLIGFFTTGITQEMDDVDLMEQLQRVNLNAIGICIETLIYGQAVDKEIEHLVIALKGTYVNYGDLLWEVGFWTVEDKMTFIREVFWVQDSDKGKESELKGRPSCLGILSFAIKINSNWTEENLLEDFIFIRNQVLGHQEGSYHRYTGPKGDIGTNKSIIEWSLRKESPRYMLKLVEEIRALQWPMLSPIFRSKSDYKMWFENLLPAAQPNLPVQVPNIAAPGPATQPSTSVPIAPANQMPGNNS